MTQYPGLAARSRELTRRFRAAGVNAEEGLAGSVILYLDDEQAEITLAALQMRDPAVALPHDPGAVRPLTWHKGIHPWDGHDGYPRHRHFLNGTLIVARGDTRLHFAGGPPFRDQHAENGAKP